MSQPIEYTTTVTPNRTTTTVNGRLHSINDQPADVWTNGSKIWYDNGELHRDNDQPAVVQYNGGHTWYYRGRRHRDIDQPAKISANGDKIWCIYGKLHRDNDQPAEVWANGSQFWYINGKKHRGGNQPAEIYADGTQHWYIDGILQPSPVINVDNYVVSFVVNKYAVDNGIVLQKINICNSGKVVVDYLLELIGHTIYYTIDVKINDLNNITKMRVVDGDMLGVDAMVNGEWISSKSYKK